MESRLEFESSSPTCHWSWSLNVLKIIYLPYIPPLYNGHYNSTYLPEIVVRIKWDYVLHIAIKKVQYSLHFCKMKKTLQSKTQYYSQYLLSNF